jgi:hypothetical protein
MDFPRPIRFNGGQTANAFREKTDEDAGICNSSGRVASMGANQIVAQEYARRQLRADRPHRRRQAGLFDEVRDLASPGNATSGGSRAGAAAGAGSTAERDFRLVLRTKTAGPIGQSCGQWVRMLLASGMFGCKSLS